MEMESSVMKKMGVISSNLAFFGQLEDKFREKYELHAYEHTMSNGTNCMQVGKLLEKCDVIFVDYAQIPLRLVIQLMKNEEYIDKPLIVRFHRKEVYNNEIYDAGKWDWNRVDLAIFSSEHVAERFRNKVSVKPKKSVVVGTNGVKLDLFKPNGGRKFEKPYKICMVGSILPIKRIYEMVKLMPLLGEEFLLSVVGEFRRPNYLAQDVIEYYEIIMDYVSENGITNVNLIGSMKKDELVEFLDTQDIIVSNSMVEGTHVSLAEGMSSGCWPFINNWLGSDKIYPERCIFKNEVDLVCQIEEWSKLSVEDKKMGGQFSRQYAEENFDGSLLAAEVLNYVEGIK